MNWERVILSLKASAEKQLSEAHEYGNSWGVGNFTAGLVLAALAIAFSEGLSDEE